MKRRLLGCLLAALGAAVQAAGFLPVEDSVQPLKERLAVLELELAALRPRLQQPAAFSDSPAALRERALAWARMQVLVQEQTQLKVELAEAHRDAKDPMRLY
ncbi:hypothetical protein H5407_18145 [Mitsuaria sp. WAJ17]|uniref:hypothetical protein n=1 Tax=Mitsuaria sp. WAJ17 TaxID=2761452 RepID=UPI001603797C|nr:hypothetical protein [Mitsuaria sp. WAJ17]MBB2487157.1 hypothetical protein [Mitsuaria sp. WAJ17]